MTSPQRRGDDAGQPTGRPAGRHEPAGRRGRSAGRTRGRGASSASEHSIWDETSLIGKIFIGFGALLTIASAARMFMA